MPHGHVTRSPLHTLFLNGDVVLRTETSASQIRVMESQPPPVYMVSLGRVYRRDTVDAKHIPDLPPMRGPRRRRGHHARRPQGTLLHLARALFGDDREVRFVTDFFPFTEPSLRRRSRASSATGPAARVCKQTGLDRDGRLRPRRPERALATSATTPKRSPGFAFGARPRAHRDAAPRRPGHPHVLGKRPPLPEPILMRFPLTGCATTSRSTPPGRSSPTARHGQARSSGSITAESPTTTATSASTGSDACSRPASTRTPTACSSAGSTWARASRARSSAAPGTSARAQGRRGVARRGSSRRAPARAGEAPRRGLATG